MKCQTACNAPIMVLPSCNKNLGYSSRLMAS